MHIFVTLLGALGILGLLLYRFSLLKQGADDVIDTNERATGARRRHKRRSKAERASLETETDPRAAAAAVAVSIAESSGPLDAPAEAALRREFQKVLGVREGTELLAYGRWLTKDVDDPNAVSDRVAGLLNKQFWQTQKESLLDMLARVTSGDPVQVRAISHLRTRLSL